MTYGAYLYDNQSNNTPITFWEYITRAWYWTSASLKLGNDKQAYLKSHRDFIDELYRSYPEIATLEDKIASVGNYSVRYTIASRWIDEPYTIIDFKASSREASYYVRFDLVGENSISGIFFWRDKNMDWYGDSTNPMHYIKQCFDWFHVTSIEEAICKARSMVKDIIAANAAGDWNSLTRSLSRLHPFYEFEWSRVITIQQQCLSEVAASLDNQCSALLRSLNVKHDISKFTKLVQCFSDKLKNSDYTVPDDQQLRSRIDLAQANAKYVVNGHSWNFAGNKQEAIAPKQNTSKLRLSKKPRKKTLLGLIHQFARRLLNSILMPVIKSLWYQDTYDDNFVAHTFCTELYISKGWYKVMDEQNSKPRHPFQAYLADIWVHPNDVTVQHAVPRAWPLTAATLARRIIPSLCNAVSSLLHYHWDLLQHGTTSRNLEEVDALFELLRQFDVIPLEHIQRVRDVLVK